ncbi:MAG: histidine phosphatase family protein [Alphaproteobacteria bacterium]|nr:histidine phosphatase family protein [Alphaproteobacteria bacterium]
MLQLTLLRHAKADPDDGKIDDFDRALADIGRTDVPRTARALVEGGASPNIVLVSEARRTRETWELARPFFPKADICWLRSLYLCPAETLLAEAVRSGGERVMLVGHNPGLHELASRLAHRNTKLDMRLRAGFPTAAGAIFDRKNEEASWKLRAYVTPRDL